MTKGNIYKVVFTTPPLSDDDRTEFYFTSLAAIYDTFTVEQVGCGYRRLYNLKVPSGTPYNGRLCQITRETFSRKTQNNPCEGRKKSRR